MELSTAIKLIENGIDSTNPSTWADLGAGTGLFTRALATLLAKGSIIYAIDGNKASLNKIETIEDIAIEKVISNFEDSNLQLPPLNGILMANSLHFVKDKISFIKKANTWLKPDGCFVIVEYNTNKSNAWVPYPISFESAKKLFGSLGFQIQLIGEEKSKYNKDGMYAALVNAQGSQVIR